MKTYEDARISFSFPDDFKFTRKKEKWGQYTLQKKDVTLTIHLMTEDTIESAKRLINSKVPQEVEDCAEAEYFDSVEFENNRGIGHVVTLYDQSHNFEEKLYRYLFSSSGGGGIYVEISSSQDFEISTYQEVLRSIQLKE